MASAAFEGRYQAWRRHLESRPEIMASSWSRDSTDNEPYRAIIELGPAALPDLIDKLAEGEHLLNAAMFAITGLTRAAVVPHAHADYSEQEISRFLLAWWGARGGAGP